MYRSLSSILAEVVNVLANNKINKGNIASRLITEYPRVFLSIFNCEYETFLAESEVEDRHEEILETNLALRNENLRIAEANERLQEQVTTLRRNPTPVTERPRFAELPSTAMFFSGVTESDLEPWMLTALAYCRKGRKIEAIKFTRHTTASGLKEAKVWCDELCEYFRITAPFAS